MNLIHLLLNTPIPLDSPKWTDKVQAIASVVIPIVAPFIVDPIQEKLQGNGANFNPKRTLDKLEKILNSPLNLTLQRLKEVLPNSQFIEKLLKNSTDRQEQIQNKINQLKIRSEYRIKAEKWLKGENKRKEIAYKASKFAFNKQHNTPDMIKNSHLYGSIILFLKVIYKLLGSVTKERENLNKCVANTDSLKQPLSFYIDAFNDIKKQAYNDLEPKAAKEVESYLEYLKTLFREKFTEKVR